MIKTKAFRDNRIRAVHVLAVMMLLVNSAAAAENIVSYNDDIKPILRQHCLKCHGDDEQESGLNLQSYASAIKGGGGGTSLVAGRPSASLLYQAITNEDADARMPPNQPPLPEQQVALIVAWINGGLLETADGKSLLGKRDLTFQPMASSNGDVDGPPPMPEDWPAIELPTPAHKAPIVSMDTSPRAPIVAIADWQYVRLVNTETAAELGALPFPEGTPQVIRFSRDGAVLMVAGGKPVQSGRVVLFDVRSGKRLAEIGDEVDAVLAADFSPDQRMVALGGSGKVVKIFDTSDGSLKFKLGRHTDWITGIAFSPDGTKLATADRAGGLHIWDASNGGILLTLAEHKSSIHSLHWRGDSRLLASAGEDGLLVWWDTVDGWPAITRNNAHPPKRPDGYYGNLRNGILSASFGPQGTLLTTGRDHVVRYWTADGNVTRSFDISGAIPLCTSTSFDGQTLLAGDSKGELHFFHP